MLFRSAYSYINNKRQKKLKSILEKTQPQIEDISKKLQQAIHIAATNLRQNYDENSIKLARQLGPNSSIGMETRKKIITKLVELNDDYLLRLRILEALNNSYRSLPIAHIELVTAIEKPENTLETIKELYKNGKHMYDLSREMNESK